MQDDGRTMIRLTMLFAVLASGLCAWVHGADFPPLPKAGQVLVLPKGQAIQVGGFTGPQGAPVKEGTDVTVSWDDEALAVVFDCVDSAIADQFAKERDHGATWKDDSVQVYIDIGHKREKGRLVALKLSAAGGFMDRRGKSVGYNIEGVDWAVTRTKNGWRGHIRIPWKGLGARPEPGERWGLNLTRIDHEGKTYANMKYMAWSPFVTNFEDVDYWGYVVFAAAGTEVDQELIDAEVKTLQTEIGKAHIFPEEGYVLVVPKGGQAKATDFCFIDDPQKRPRQATVATVSWDAEALLVVFDCTDDAIAAVHTERDDIKMWKDDSVYVWLDLGHTHNAEGRLTMIQVSATGAVHDVHGGDIGFTVEGIKAEATRTKTGWRAQLRMPWKGLGVAAPKPGDVWGLNLSRMDQPAVYNAKDMDASYWAPLPGSALQIDRWGQVVFAPAGAGPDDATVAATREAILKTHEARRRVLLGEE